MLVELAQEFGPRERATVGRLGGKRFPPSPRRQSLSELPPIVLALRVRHECLGRSSAFQRLHARRHVAASTTEVVGRPLLPQHRQDSGTEDVKRQGQGKTQPEEEGEMCRDCSPLSPGYL